MPAPRPKIIRKLDRWPVVSRQARNIHDTWRALKLRHAWDWTNRGAVKAFESNRPTLNAVQQRIVGDLQQRGIAFAQFDELFDQSKWEALLRPTEEWLATEDVKEKERAYKEGGHKSQAWKEYIIRKYSAQPVLDADDPYLLFGLEPELLDVVNSYLGLESRLLTLDVWDTIALEHSGEDTGSQRWHRDPEDRKLVKVFLYFSEVDKDSGPLQYVAESRHGDKYGDFWPQRLPKGTTVGGKELEERIPPSEWVTCTGSPGTLTFVDTSGIHKGGRATSNNRVLANWIYVTKASIFPRAFTVQNGSTPRLVGAQRTAFDA